MAKKRKTVKRVSSKQNKLLVVLLVISLILIGITALATGKRMLYQPSAKTTSYYSQNFMQKLCDLRPELCQTKKNPRFDTQSRFYTCTKDFDCISVSADCCGCNQGGKATAVNKKYKSSWESSKRKECKGQICLQVISEDPSCQGVPRCVNNTCTLVSETN